MRHFFEKMMTELLYDLFKKSAGVTTDTRSLKEGQLFFALRGDKYNGNRFAPEAVAKGAIAAVVDDPVFRGEKTIVVDDSLAELQSLASHHRSVMAVPVLAVTGTNGKTTTKELLGAVLGVLYKVHFSRNNLNNHIGVPLTLLDAPEGTEFVIVEMGANHIGEISGLCRIAKPDYGIVTNTGLAHIEGFGSEQGVMTAKKELFDYLRSVNGVALYNDGDPKITTMVSEMQEKAVPFSRPSASELSVQQLPSDLYLIMSASYDNKVYNIDTEFFGSYNFENIKAAVATGLYFGGEITSIIKAIEGYRPSNNRSQVMITSGNRVICDSYNANPTSMLLTLESFGEIKSGSKFIILGDMLELGDKSQEEHSAVIKLLDRYNKEDIILVGREFMKLSERSGIRSFEDVTGLKKFLREKPLNNRTILVKGSRGIGLEEIYDLL